MSPARIVLAYHGCDREVGERILTGETEIRPSTNDYDWLGAGAYFWEDSPARARHWANFLREFPASSHRGIREPFVIGAVIATGNCLDLTDVDSLKLVRQSYEEYVRLVGNYGSPPPSIYPDFEGITTWSNVIWIAPF